MGEVTLALSSGIVAHWNRISRLVSGKPAVAEHGHGLAFIRIKLAPYVPSCVSNHVASDCDALLFLAHVFRIKSFLQRREVAGAVLARGLRGGRGIVEIRPIARKNE